MSGKQRKRNFFSQKIKHEILSLFLREKKIIFFLGRTQEKSKRTCGNFGHVYRGFSWLGGDEEQGRLGDDGDIIYGTCKLVGTGTFLEELRLSFCTFGNSFSFFLQFNVAMTL